MKSYVCFECKEKVSEDILILEKIPTPEGKTINRRFHKNCHEEYTSRMSEFPKWDKLYRYVQVEILQLGEKPLSKHTIMRLQSFRKGKYINKKKNESRVYTYDEIYYTFVFTKTLIMDALRKIDFKNDSHRIDYIMVIISNHINDISDRINRKVRANEMLESQVLDLPKVNPNKYQKKEQPKASEHLKYLL